MAAEVAVADLKTPTHQSKKALPEVAVEEEEEVARGVVITELPELVLIFLPLPEAMEAVRVETLGYSVLIIVLLLGQGLQVPEARLI